MTWFEFEGRRLFNAREGTGYAAAWDAPVEVNRKGDDMHRHLMHLLMCSPMILVGIILLAGGANVLVAFVPVLGCVLMMGLMMWMMGHGVGHRDRSS